jgi:hypothetical protein
MVFKFTQLSPLRDTGFTDPLPNMGLHNTSDPPENLEVCFIYFVQLHKLTRLLWLSTETGRRQMWTG